MEKVLSLEINSCPAKFFREASGEKQRSGAPSIGAQQFVQTALKAAVLLSLLVVPLQFI
jgi:hypothetical protein